MKKSGVVVKALKINKNGAAQRFLVSEIRRCCDPYVPLLHGPLKNTAVEEATCVRYVMPYAIKQYFTNKGKGMRGRYWDRRMWAHRGPEIKENTERFIKR